MDEGRWPFQERARASPFSLREGSVSFPLERIPGAFILRPGWSGSFLTEGGSRLFSLGGGSLSFLMEDGSHSKLSKSSRLQFASTMVSHDVCNDTTQTTLGSMATGTPVLTTNGGSTGKAGSLCT